MSIRHELVETVKTTPDRAFAAIDDVALTPKWLPPCVSLTKLAPGPNAVGDKLRYVYKQRGKQSEMDGEIVDRVPGRRLHCRYFDKMFEVSVDMLVAAAPEGATTTHIIEITPRTMSGKLMAPLIKVGLKSQTRQAASNLKHLLEAKNA